MENQNTPATTETNDSADALDSRAAALFEQLSGESVSAGATDDSGGTTDGTKRADAAPDAAERSDSAPDADPATKARRERIAARQAEIQRMAEEERARVAAARERKREQPPAPEPNPASKDLGITDAASFFAAAERLNIAPQDLASWLTSQQDPSKVAAYAAKQTVSPLEAKLAEYEQQLRNLEAGLRQREEQAQTAQLVERNKQLLVGHLDSVKDDAPRTAAFYSESPSDFFDAVYGICDKLPNGFTAQDVIDELEESLTKLRAFGPSTTPATNTSTERKPKPAAAPASVGNRLASERATVVDDTEEDGGDLEERARKLKSALRTR